MPRYSTINILDKNLLTNPVSIQSEPSDVNLHTVYKSHTKDIKLSWDNDLVFSSETMDYEIVSGLEALAQRIYLRLSVQKGKDHTRPDFGWDFEYIIDRNENEVKALLPILLRDFVDAIKQESGVVGVKNANAYLVHLDEQTSVIRLVAEVIPSKGSQPLPIGIELA